MECLVKDGGREPAIQALGGSFGGPRNPTPPARPLKTTS